MELNTDNDSDRVPVLEKTMVLHLEPFLRKSDARVMHQCHSIVLRNKLATPSQKKRPITLYCTPQAFIFNRFHSHYSNTSYQFNVRHFSIYLFNKFKYRLIVELIDYANLNNYSITVAYY